VRIVYRLKIVVFDKALWEVPASYLRSHHHHYHHNHPPFLAYLRAEGKDLEYRQKEISIERDRCGI